jgi:hypothetical protein
MNVDTITNTLYNGVIITDSYNYFRVISFSESETVMFGTNLINFELEPVMFNHNKWEWESIGDIFKQDYLPQRISISKPVDYVLISDRLKDRNGSFVDTYLDIEEDDFDDIEVKTRFMLDDGSLYSDFRKQYHIVDVINTVDTHEKAIDEINKLRSIDIERFRKINLID